MSARFRRQKLTTILVVVEGDTELALCLHLKRLLSRGVGAKITVECANGGGALQAIRSAERFLRYADFDHCFAMYDEDTPVCDECRRLSDKHSIRHLISRPHCIAGWLLCVLGLSVPGSSGTCKRTFHGSVMSEREKLNQERYQSIFPPEELLQESHPDPLADKLIKIFKNQMDA